MLITGLEAACIPSGSPFLRRMWRWLRQSVRCLDLMTKRDLLPWRPPPRAVTPSSVICQCRGVCAKQRSMVAQILSCRWLDTECRGPEEVASISTYVARCGAMTTRDCCLMRRLPALCGELSLASSQQQEHHRESDPGARKQRDGTAREGHDDSPSDSQWPAQLPVQAKPPCCESRKPREASAWAWCLINKLQH